MDCEQLIPLCTLGVLIPTVFNHGKFTVSLVVVGESVCASKEK